MDELTGQIIDAVAVAPDGALAAALREHFPVRHGAGRLVVTPHAVTLEGQQNLECDLRPGESLYTFLSRHVDLTQRWEVCIGGVVVPVEHWTRIYPKHGQVIECRASVGKSVLRIVATVALLYFAWWAAPYLTGSFGVLAGASTALVASGIYMAGSMLINRVLGPKVGGLDALGKQQDPTFALNSQRNTFRAYEPSPLLFGKCKVTPDLATDQAYAFFRGDDQYLALTLNLGVNVDRVDDLYNGEALLSSFAGVEVYHTGFAGMTDDGLPLYSNTDTVTGGSLDSPVGTYVQRTSADDAVRVELDFEYNIYNYDSKGKPKYNTEGITIQWRLVGSPTWDTTYTTSLSGSKPKIQRFSIGFNLTQGQYEFQVKRNGTSSSDTEAHCEVTWTSLRAVQNDTGNYKGLSRIGVVCKATGQLNGALDELRCVAYAEAIEGWNGSAWVTSADYISNPGAQILKYARGWYDVDGVLIAGMGRPDSRIDLESIKGFIAHCAANGYTYDYYLKEARSHDDVLNTIALAGFGQISRAGGKLSVVWAADEQPLSGVVNMATIKRGQFQVDYTLAGAADGIEFTYLDQSDWTNKTLRVSAPGVTTPLNPARVAGEGITSETHAAEMARYHLAQSLYQYKTITFGTDLEHLSYGRFSKLALQHDLTQWGYGGRVQSVAVDGDGVVTVGLDEPVPAGATPHIGLRVPGEAVYRVFEVEPPAEETRTIVLVDGWPVDLPDVPGDSDANPAHDTIWIYDFKSDPGYAVRVVGIEPENGMKGASVTCVPESAEFWTYVKTGDYEPPAASTLPSVRPVASNLQVTEQVISQGGTAYSELSVAFDIAGNMGRALVFAQYTDTIDPLNPITDGEVRKVAETATREASFRIPGKGTYDITVLPYSVDGVPGGSASASYDTENTDSEPTAFDVFAVSEQPGGLRRYIWGYNPGTIPPPDLAGAVIRYFVSEPSGDPYEVEWDDMAELGAEGFHATFFDSFDPPGGAPTYSNATTYAIGDRVSLDGTVYKSLQNSNLNHDVTDASWWEGIGAGMTYVFAAKPRTANGIEPAESDTRYAITLSQNLIEIVDGLDATATDAAAAAAAAQAAADDAQAAADAASAAASDAIGNVNDIIGAPEWDAATTYANGAYAQRTGVLYQSKAGSNLNHQPPNATWWNVAGSIISTLDVQAGVLNSQGFDIIDLQDGVAANASAISAANTAIEGKADASALASLESTVATQGDDITANAAAIIAADINAGGSAANTTFLALSGTVATQGDDITSVNSAVIALENTVNDPDTGVVHTASVVATMGTSIDTLTDTLEAYYVLELDVDGNISGIYLLNDGVTSSVTFKASAFGVLDTTGGNSLTWNAGVMTALSGSNSLKLGAGFGSDTDKLILWYGADGASSSRTFANAKVAITASGKPKLAGTGTNFAAGWSGAALTSSYSSASPAVVTINAASGTFTSLGTAVSYSASSNTVSQTRGTTVRYYCYYSDAGLSGGSKTLNISTDPTVAYADPDKVYLGLVDVTVPASGSGSGGSGGGSNPCVSVDAWVIRNGQRSRAGDVEVGDTLALFDPALGASDGLVTYSVPALTDMVRIVTEHGHTLTCSTTAPIPTERAGCVLAPDLMGHRVLVAVGEGMGWEVVADIVRLPRGWVQHITVGDRCFWAADADAYLLHHNIKVGP